MKSLLFLLLFLGISCQHTPSVFEQKEWMFKKWVVNTLSEFVLTNRVFQGSPTNLTSTSIIQGDSLYGIRSYDRVYGNIQWVFPVIGGVEGGIRHLGERLFFGGSDGYFYCLEVSTGRVLWKYSTGVENLGTPYVFQDTVYFINSKDALLALKATTGELKWVYTHSTINKQTRLTVRGVSQPVVDSKRVYAGFSDGSFVAIDRMSGKKLWQKSLAKESDSFKDVDVHPIISGRIVYVGSYSGGLFAFNKVTGRLMWKHAEGVYANPTVDEKVVYYSTTNQKIIALNRFSGRVKWSKPLKSFATQPLLYKGTLIFGLSDKGLYVLDKSNGKRMTEVNLFKGLTTRPTLDTENRELFVMSNEFWLYKFDLLF